jgi:hypothetical protein
LLRRLAEAATPGPWWRGDDSTSVHEADHGWIAETSVPSDAAFIAAANAAVVLALLARAEKAEAERDVARFAPLGDNHHNALRCPYCNPEQIDPAAERAARQCAEAERDHARKAVEMVIGDTATELGCVPDSEAILAAIAALKAERDHLLEALGDKDEALLHIAQWAEAYSEDIFPPVDVASARLKLGDDALFSRLHAEWARRLCKGLGAIARPALKETGHD